MDQTRSNLYVQRMTWIHIITPEQADGELAELYDAIGQARGGVAAIHQAQSLNPRAIRAHLELYKTVMFARSSLSRVTRERLGVIVSAANDCAYCIAHHAEAARQLGDDDATLDALERGVLPADLPANERALFDWARFATMAPARPGKPAIGVLRRTGWTDAQILDATLVVAYFNFVNRLVLLLGVELEAGFEATCRG